MRSAFGVLLVVILAGSCASSDARVSAQEAQRRCTDFQRKHYPNDQVSAVGITSGAVRCTIPTGPMVGCGDDAGQTLLNFEVSKGGSYHQLATTSPPPCSNPVVSPTNP